MGNSYPHRYLRLFIYFLFVLNDRIPWHTIVQVHHNQTFQSLVHIACTVPKLHFWAKRWKIASFFSLIHGPWIGLDSHVCLPIKHPVTKWVKVKRFLSINVLLIKGGENRAQYWGIKNIFMGCSITTWTRWGGPKMPIFVHIQGENCLHI